MVDKKRSSVVEHVAALRTEIARLDYQIWSAEAREDMDTAARMTTIQARLILELSALAEEMGEI